MGKGLCDYHSCVEGELPVAIFGCVFVAVEYLPRVKRHRNTSSWCNTPAIEEPFDRYFEMLDCCVGVDEDDESVALEELVENVWFYPCVVHSLSHVVCVDELVVIAMYLCCGMSI